MNIQSFCRRLFMVLFVWPVTLLWTGYALGGREHLPAKGPAIVVANHNSHLDALMLLTFFPLKLVPSVRPAAAADYFFSSRAARFFSETFLGLLPLQRRRGGGRDPLAPLAEALDRGDIVVLFPEGTRGRPDVMEAIKPGLWHLARRYPAVPIHPVYMHGPGRSLPKGAWIPVPLFADVRAGEPLFFHPNKRIFLDGVRECFTALRAETLAAKTAVLDDDDN